MTYNIKLARFSVAIIVIFFVRLMLIVMDLSVVGGIALGLEYSMVTIGSYGIVLLSFIISFSFFMRTRSIKDFKVLLISATCLILLITVVFGIVYFYASTVEGF